MKAFVIAMQFPQYLAYLKGLTSSGMPVWDKSVTTAKMFEYEELAKRELDIVFIAKPDYLVTIRDVFDSDPKKPELYIMEVSTDPVFVFTDDEVEKRLEIVTNEKASAQSLKETIDAITKGFRS